MGQFIGHMGGFFILAAAVMIAGLFFWDSGLVKDKRSVAAAGKTALLAAACGMVYYFLMAYMRNIFGGQTNFFDFGKIFTFFGADKLLNLYQTPSFKESVSGLNMPLFIYLTHFIGGVVFEQYAGTAMFLNFLAAAGGSVCISQIARDVLGDKAADQIVFAVLALPFAFALFIPACFGIVFGLTACAAYALYKKRTVLYVILTIAAILTSKLGLLALLLLIPAKVPGLSDLARRLQNSRFFKNPYCCLGALLLILTIDGFVIMLTMGGAI